MKGISIFVKLILKKGSVGAQAPAYLTPLSPEPSSPARTIWPLAAQIIPAVLSPPQLIGLAELRIEDDWLMKTTTDYEEPYLYIFYFRTGVS